MSGIEEKFFAIMCFRFLTNLFTEYTVHACKMFIHLKFYIYMVAQYRVAMSAYSPGWAVPLLAMGAIADKLKEDKIQWVNSTYGVNVY